MLSLLREILLITECIRLHAFHSCASSTLQCHKCQALADQGQTKSLHTGEVQGVEQKRLFRPGTPRSTGYGAKRRVLEVQGV